MQKSKSGASLKIPDKESILFTSPDKKVNVREKVELDKNEEIITNSKQEV